MPNNIIKGQVIPINQANIDTDSIIPKQYLKAITKTGFGPFLFDSWRYKDPGDLSTKNKRRINEEFILNQEPFSSGNILIVNNNFGCGSSREHAAWALKDFGFRTILAPSFADIFRENADQNGLAALSLEESVVRELLARAHNEAPLRLTVDLEQCTVADSGTLIASFEIDDFRKMCLLEGLDRIGLTLRQAEAISLFEQQRWPNRPEAAPESL